MKENKLFNKIIEKSKLTLKDALELGKKVNEGIYKKYQKRIKRN